MITITKGQSNEVILTLKENQSLTDPDFLFKFINDTTGKSKLFSADDTSSFTDRFNRFLITETSSESLLEGKVSLSPAGFWSYTVYEMTQGSPNDLDPANAVKVLELGKVNVIDPSPSGDVEFSEEDSINNSVFDDD